MKLVVVCGRTRLIKQALDDMEQKYYSIHITQIEGPKIYLDIRTSLSQDETIHSIRQMLHKHPITCGLDFQVYGFYKGRIDFLSYMSDDVKKKFKYYQC